MQTIVVPTDFSIRSLNIITGLAEKKLLQNASIILVHSLDMPTSMQDLLFVSRTRRENQQLISRHFSEACEVIRNKYSSMISSIRIQFLYGNSSRVFRNFLQASKAELVAFSSTCNYRSVSRNSVDMLPFIRKSSFPSVEILVAQRSGLSHSKAIADLLPVEERLVGEAV